MSISLESRYPAIRVKNIPDVSQKRQTDLIKKTDRVKSEKILQI